MHILEIVSHLLREQNPSALADAALRRSGQEKLRDDQELLAMRVAESEQRLVKVKQYSAARYSHSLHFCITFYKINLSVTIV